MSPIGTYHPRPSVDLLFILIFRVHKAPIIWVRTYLRTRTVSCIHKILEFPVSCTVSCIYDKYAKICDRYTIDNDLRFFSKYFYSKGEVWNVKLSPHQEYSYETLQSLLNYIVLSLIYLLNFYKTCLRSSKALIEFLIQVSSKNLYLITRDGGKWWSKDHHLVVIKMPKNWLFFEKWWKKFSIFFVK